jgi:hypothetical protein
MMAALILEAGVPLMQRLFPPVPLVLQVQQTPALILAVLDLCLAAAYLALWRAAPDFRAFRTMGFFFILVSLQLVSTYFGGAVPEASARALAAVVLIEFAGEAMRIPRRNWTRLFWPVYVFVAIAVWFPQLFFTAEWPVLISEIPLAILIVQGFRRGNTRDRIVAAAFGFYFFLRPTLSASARKFTGLSGYADIGGWLWSYTATVLTLLGAVTLVVFARDLIRDRAEKQRLAAELAASRAVQQVLIPDQIPSIAGFTVQSVYRPFGDVGGDFFQILPLADGGALVVIGDVSGKGMPAAMTVSLAVGALCLAVEATTHPGKILAALNRALLGRNHDGFTTCLIVRADVDGTLTMANAGHIAPYMDGQELQLENGLPLGLAADATYPESSFHLYAGQHILLLTDGVVEARSKTGELFGFEHTAAIAAKSAESIALAAQEFGQEDDITVLTLQRTVPA